MVSDNSLADVSLPGVRRETLCVGCSGVDGADGACCGSGSVSDVPELSAVG
jgi:hypothetical protein